MTTTLITGVGGFCGRHLAHHLSLESDACLIGTGRDTAAPDSLPLDEYIRLDVTCEQDVLAVIARTRPERIFHLAGAVRAPAAELFRVNLLGSIHLLEAVRHVVPAARVLVCGSAAEYGKVQEDALPIEETHTCQPFGAYGMSKYAMTRTALDYAHTHGLKVVVVRPFNILGAGVPKSLVIGAMLQRIQEAADKPVVRIGNVETQRDFVAVDDVVRVYGQLLDAEPWGEVLNICSGRPRSIRSLVEQLLTFADHPLQLETDPDLQRPNDVPVVYGSWRKVHQLVGFQPTPDLTGALQAAWQHKMGAVTCD